MANITGEKMHVNHCLLAMERAQRDGAFAVRQFRFVAHVGKSRYEAQLEVGRDVDAAWHASAEKAIDAALCAVNVEYAEKRKSGRLHAPLLSFMPPGWSDSELRRHVGQGKRDTQFKWRYLDSVQ
jgi:hypothetical protein